MNAQTADFRARLALDVPIIQAPIAGVQGSALAIAVSSAGGGGPDGMLSKYFRTFASAVFSSTSPAIASTALFGA